MNDNPDPSDVQPDDADERPRRQGLARWRVVLLHDVDNSRDYVQAKLVENTPLDALQAAHCLEQTLSVGRALVLVTHRERAELYERQLASADLAVAIEPV